MEPNNTEEIRITWLECRSFIRYWT